MSNSAFLHFANSDEQEMIRETAERFLAENCSESLVRHVLDGNEPFARALWRNLAELGLLGVTISEEDGGTGLGPVEQCLVAEELGRVLAPLPTVSTLYLATELLKKAASADQQNNLLQEIAAGKATISVAEIDAESTPVMAESATLNGSKRLVPDAGAASHLIVIAKEKTGLPSLFLVDCQQAAVEIIGHDVIDPSRPFGSVRFTDAQAYLIGEPGHADDYLSHARTRAAIYCAFEQVGGAKSALAKASDYARERHAFGRPIGSFQAVKQLLADMYVSLAIAQANARYACWVLASNAPDLEAAAARAHLSATRAFRHCASDTIQVHGGAGFMWETTPHLYFRRSEMLARALGGPRLWQQRLVSNLEAMAA